MSPLLSEIDRLMPQGMLDLPARPLAGTSNGKGEWDWFYAEPVSVRRKLIRHMTTGGIGPDECALYAGFDYVDDWAVHLVAAVTGHDKGLSGDRGANLVDPSDLVGPAEAAAMLGKPVATIRQWVRRGVFPAELAVLSGQRVWHRADIEAWAATRPSLPATTDEVF